MKNKVSVVITLLVFITITLTGCSKYEKDESYITDVYGIYLGGIEAPSVSYSENTSYTFNADNTYNYTYKVVSNSNITNDVNTTGDILSIEEINNNITQITLDREITSWSTGETSNEIIYKYNNMLGSFYEIEVPKGKTFNLFLKNEQSTLNEGNVFDEEGNHHYCINHDDCNCDKNNFIQYIRKDNIIFFQSMDEEHNNSYTIGMYIVKDGIFIPELYKEN